MPLCERLRINAGRPFIYSLIARVLVVLLMVTMIAFFNLIKSESLVSNTDTNTKQQNNLYYNANMVETIPNNTDTKINSRYIF